MDDYKKEFERKWGLPWEETFENPKLAQKYINFIKIKDAMH